MATPDVTLTATVPTDSATVAEVRAAVPPRTARIIFWATLSYTAAFTAIWLFFVITQRDGGWLFGRYNVDRETVGRVLGGFLIGNGLWAYIWYHIRRLLLRRVAGFSKDELAGVFASRMNRTPFDLRALLAKYSERTIRVIDMAGRRGRYITIGFFGFLYVHNRIIDNPQPGLMMLGLQDTLLDSFLFSWLNLALYCNDGILGRIVYGAQSRVMDGKLARANNLLIGTLWNAFKFVMVPIGLQLTAHFPPRTYAALFGFIWLSYQVSDALSEIIGSLLGKQKLRVWGVGEVNRKSIAGTWACFLGSLGMCLWLIWVHNLPTPWLGLAIVVSLSNTFFELFSPRGTDDFTMATANALLCWGFGALVL
jgi:hypothetical protein